MRRIIKETVQNIALVRFIDYRLLHKVITISQYPLIDTRLEVINYYFDEDAKRLWIHFSIIEPGGLHDDEMPDGIWWIEDFDNWCLNNCTLPVREYFTEKIENYFPTLPYFIDAKLCKFNGVFVTEPE